MKCIVPKCKRDGVLLVTYANIPLIYCKKHRNAGYMFLKKMHQYGSNERKAWMDKIIPNFIMSRVRSLGRGY